jgi:aryl-phospho-beta-D-glucosidase BglC (GH1 family)
VAPVPDYYAQVYPTGVRWRGADINGQQWSSGTYYPTQNDLNTMKSWGVNIVRFSISAIKIQGTPYATIDYTKEGSVAKQVMDSIWLIKNNGMQIILDMHDDPCGEYFESQGECQWDPANGKYQITSSQLENFWSQTAAYFQTLGDDFNQWMTYGVANEPHEMSDDPSNQVKESAATYNYLAPTLSTLNALGVSGKVYVEPSQWGGIFEYADASWQSWFANIRGNYTRLDVIADGHAYGTSTTGPGGTGYGDCDPDGVSHNYLDQVAEWAVAKNVSLVITETNGDPSYPNCISFVQSTLLFTNMYADNFAVTIVWAYALHLDQYDPQPLDINGAGSAMVPAIQDIDYWVPGALVSMSPTITPTFRPTKMPTTSVPTYSPTFFPTSVPTISLAPTAYHEPDSSDAHGWKHFFGTTGGIATIASAAGVGVLMFCYAAARCVRKQDVDTTDAQTPLLRG